MLSYNGDVLALNDGARVVAWTFEEGAAKISFEEESVATRIALSSSGRYLATANDMKQIELYDISEGRALKLWTKPANKRLAELLFTRDDQYVIGCDRFGDVYRFKVDNATEKFELLCGHVSMLTDVMLTPDSSRLVTADREGKIRISHYPNAYNIDRFLLGHSGYVSSICMPSFAEELLVSGGGDAKLLFWNRQTGALIQELPIPSQYLDTDASSRLLKIIEFAPLSKILVIFEERKRVMAVGRDETGAWAIQDDLLELDEFPVDFVSDGKNRLLFQVCGNVSLQAYDYDSESAKFARNQEAYAAVNVKTTNPKTHLREAILFPGKHELKKLLKSENDYEEEDGDGDDGDKSTHRPKKKKFGSKTE